MEIIRIIIKLLIRNCTVPSVVIPNLFLGLVTAGASACLLKRGSQCEDTFYQFTDKYRFVIIACAGVVLSSPLPFAGGAIILKLLSVAALLIVLFAVSYMDEKTSYFIVGYLIVGILIQMVLLVAALLTGNVCLSSYSAKMLFFMAAGNVLPAVLKAYSYGDMGLMQMVLISFLVLEEGNFCSSMIIVYVASYFSLLIRDTVRLPGKIRKKGTLKFAHSLNIVIGVLAALFFVS